MQIESDGSEDRYLLAKKQQFKMWQIHADNLSIIALLFCSWDVGSLHGFVVKFSQQETSMSMKATFM